MKENNFLKDDIYPKLNRRILLSDLDPNICGNYISLTCPQCKHHEAFIWIYGEVIICNRKNKCGTNTHIWRYIKESKGFTTDFEVIKYLADLAGVPMPELNSEKMKRMEEYQKKIDLMERIQDFFVESLWSPVGAKQLEYLRNVRKYTDDDIRNMKLGYFPGFNETAQHLLRPGHAIDAIEREIESTFEFIKSRGTHQLTIPYRDCKGNLINIYGRLNHELEEKAKSEGNSDSSKYMPYGKASKASPFNMYNVRGQKEIVIVEGYLDALLANTRGMDNVIGICGSTITHEQFDMIVEAKPERILLCLDNDMAGIKGTINAIKRFNDKSIDMFVVKLPDGYKDPDQLISKDVQGFKIFKSKIDLAETCGTWLGRYIPQKYDLTKETERRSAIHEVCEWHKELNALDNNDLREESSKSLSIPEEYWKEVEDVAAEVAYEKQCDNWAKQVQQLISEGRYKEIDQLQRPTDPKKYGTAKIKFLNELEKNFLVDDPPETPYLIGIREGQTTLPFIVRGIVGSVVALGGTGKTHYLTQLALSIATCQDFLHHYPVKEKGRVVYVYGENSYDDIHRLLHKTAKGLFSFPENAPVSEKEMKKDAVNNLAIMSVHGIDASFIDKEGEPTVFYQDFCRDLNNLANKSESGLSLVVIDPASRFLGAEAENNSALATKFTALLEAITQIKGNPTVLFAHHMNKASMSSESNQGSSRGSSALTDGPRLQMNLENANEEEQIRFRVKQKMAKSNHTKIIAEAILEKDEHGCLTYIKEATNRSSEPKGKTNSKTSNKKKLSRSHKNEIENC